MSDFSQYGGASQELLDVLATLPASPADSSSVEEIKKATNEGREMSSREEFSLLKDQISLQDHSVPARDGYILSARSYRPTTIPLHITLPVYIHFHGGGFLFGTLDSEDATCARIALASDVVVFNLNYRHSPEWKYPTAWHDAEDAFEWVVAHASKSFHGDPTHVVVGGVSAGGHLAAALTLTKKRENASSFASIKGQVLMIPGLAHMAHEDQLKHRSDMHHRSSSYQENEFAPLLPVSKINWFNDLVHSQAPLASDRRINILAASSEEVHGLPPTTFGIAGLDPLRDEALLYANVLAENGVPTDVHLFKGVPHGFRRFGVHKLSLCRDYDRVMHDGIRWALSHPPANIKVEVNVHEGLGR